MIVDSTVRYNARDNTLECSACYCTIEVHRRILRDPEAFTSFLELTQLDHADCHKYNDPKMARNARRFRKDARRYQLQGKHAIGNA